MSIVTNQWIQPQNEVWAPSREETRRRFFRDVNIYPAAPVLNGNVKGKAKKSEWEEVVARAIAKRKGIDLPEEEEIISWEDTRMGTLREYFGGYKGERNSEETDEEDEETDEENDEGMAVDERYELDVDQF